MTDFLQKELLLKEQILMFEKSKFEIKKTGEYTPKTYVSEDVSKINKCFFCGKIDHVPTITSKGRSIINGFACNKFAGMNPRERFNELKSKKLCFQCLNRGLEKGHSGRCYNKYTCPDESQTV